MRDAIGKLVDGPKSRTGILYIPSNLMIDSAFPFQAPTQVKITIEGDKLIVTKDETTKK
ncbi:MAG: hypothetical protein LBE70_02640 [Nitrososphaerota archaeon]|jgi:hypothetical protein|nr:hypothetical protein [Nitrososphaerota archaeon]